jgi:arylformamidase
VLQISHDTESITAQVLQRAEIPPRTRRLLFKTRNSEFWAQNKRDFRQDFVSLSLDGAQYLVERGVKLVGIDYLSVAPYKEGGPIHETLLKAGVVIVEGLNLYEISQGRYALYCLPLKIKGADGAPARAILVGV